MYANTGGEHDEGKQVEHRHGQGVLGQGQEFGLGHGSDRGGRNGTGFGHGAYS